MAISLFFNWLLSSSLFRISILSLVSRGASFSSRIAISSTESAFEFPKSKDRTILEETLLTFCPPAPLLLTALNFSSDIIFSVSKIIAADVPVLVNRLLFLQD